jgi:hypothetical protein
MPNRLLTTHFIRSFCFIGSLAFLGGLFPSELQGASKPYLLEADQQAELTMKRWENESFPLGNGYMGVSFFGVGERNFGS